MSVKICPECDAHNHVTAQFCKSCEQELKSVGITKLPTNVSNKKLDNPADKKTEQQTPTEESLFPTLVSRFLFGFFGWFLCATLLLGVVLAITDSMGPLGIILVPFTFVPILATILAIVLAFLIPKFRARRVPTKIKGMAFGLITAYSINFVVNFILNMPSDPLAIVGSILGWPFYMIWLDKLFDF